MIHSATPSVNRREERRLRERLAAIDGKLDKMVVGKMMDQEVVSLTKSSK